MGEILLFNAFYAMEYQLSAPNKVKWIHLDVPVERASLRQDLAAVRTNDAVDAVDLPDVGVEVGQSFLVAAQRTTLGWWDRVQETSCMNFTFFGAVIFEAQLLQDANHF